MQTPSYNIAGVVVFTHMMVLPKAASLVRIARRINRFSHKRVYDLMSNNPRKRDLLSWQGRRLPSEMLSRLHMVMDQGIDVDFQEKKNLIVLLLYPSTPPPFPETHVGNA